MRFCFVIPVYNHGKPLQRTVAELVQYGLPIVIVDDGSDRPTKDSIASIAQRYDVQIVTLPTNGGKGRAVMAGLRAAAERCHSHVIQVDADGQHDLADVPKLIEASRRAPDAFVTGAPRFDDSVPASRLHGRRLTNFWVRIETLGTSIPDAMCGFRVYPLASCIPLIDSVSLGTRMDFDIEIAVRLHWRGVPAVSIPTRVVYPDGNTSNFRLLHDNWLITKLHTKLVLGMLVRSPILIRRQLRKGRHWSRLSERGAVIGMQLLFAAYRRFGRGAFTVLLYPVIGYFLITATEARRASRSYLARMRKRLRELGRPAPRRLSSFGHILDFGHAVLDKGAMWAGAFPTDSIEFADEAMFERLRAQGRGSLFIGSHLGNLEVLRAFGETAQDMTVNALVFTRHSPKFNRVLSNVSPRAFRNMIQVDSLGPESVIALQRKIRNGEHVAIVGDRVSVRHEDRCIRAPFLGEPAPFPEGPFILASLLACPVYLLFCLKMDGRYKIFVEPFADPLELPRERRRDVLEQVVHRYVERLESYCLMAPTQWFNFFDFWNQGKRE